MSITTIVIRFLKDKKFPKFGIQANERWLIRSSTRAPFINNLTPEETFDFGGGECYKKDIEVLYYGTDFKKANIIQGDKSLA